MKKKNIFLCMLAILFFTNNIIIAQRIHNNIYVNDAKAWQTGNKLSIEMAVDGSKANLQPNEAIILTPAIKADNNIMELPKIVIKGSTRYKADNRARFFDKKNTDNNIILLKKSESSKISYTQTLSFEEWMRTATFTIKQELIGCAECKKNEDWDSIGDGIIVEQPNISKPEIRFTISYIAPKTEAVKNRDYEGSAFLDFQVGKSVIIPDFRNNFKELSKIDDILGQLKNDKNATITSINLCGYASPEGSYELNNRLSASRTQALKNYLQNRYNFDNSLFNTNSVAEDWAGLKKIVEESYLPDKDKLMEIINSTLSEDAKEQKLKTQASYRTLLNEHFPALRRVDYKLDYIVRAFSIEEGKEIVKTKPGQMSLNEMFLVANSYEKGSNEFKELFDIAVRVYPKDVIANINAAAIELEKGDTAAAHRYLDKYQDISDSWNNLGILYALEGNMDKAKEFFLKAQINGSSEASENLEKVKLLENYEQRIINQK
ncbi:DUF3868 domain-containing protein [uncultured Dysgonomonas sp.]|uniref:DUF3868 domain-containing protein n=1 Tax=uncultured Dysgonomonas sp. TaxID=206096 RepID=A0A212JW58_9BACT|nr:DUF3868 domain-containing protein [uncultured Dysgonomonas sp.]SBW03681.1 conserved exported hypothetical protein [uncultured Dysgonomonas sp.]